MPIAARLSLALLAMSCATAPSAGQFREDRPRPFSPLTPPTRAQADQRDALKLYALGLIAEREDRIVEALRSYEGSLRLDPKAAAVHQALIPIYMAMDRQADALAASRKSLDLDPASYQGWFLHARLLGASGKLPEAAQALKRGLACPGVKDRPDLQQKMHFNLAVLHEQAQSYDEAAAEFTEAAAILEHSEALHEGPFARQELLSHAAELHERAGRLHLKDKKLDKAVASLRKAQAAYPDGAARLSLSLAQVCQEQGNLADALGHFDTYLRLQPQGTEAYEQKIALLGKLKREGEVVPWLERAAAADRHNLGLKMLLGREYGRAGRHGQAEKLYQDLGAQSPSPDVYRGLFALYRDAPGMGMIKALDLLNQTIAQARQKAKAGADTSAPAQVRAMIAVFREDAGLAKELLRVALPRLDAGGELQSETLHLLGVLADRGKLLEEAERCYRRCLKDPPDKSEAVIYGGLLRVLWKAHKYEDVVALCREGLKNAQATNHVLFHSELARALARLGKGDDAVAAAEQAVRLAADPDRFAARHLRVRVLTQAGKLDRAEEECQALMKDAGEAGAVHEVRYLLSHVYSSAGNYPKAEEQLQLILKADPANTSACNDLGYLWADRGKNLEEAERLIRRALELDREQRKGRPGLEPDADRDNAAYIDSLGWVLFRRGRFDEARVELERAVALPDGNDPVLWDHLGDVYHRLGQPTRARSSWERSLRLYEQERRPDRDQRYQDLREKLKLLQP